MIDFLEHILFVITLALGSRPKQGLAKVWAKNEAWKSHFMLSEMWENVKEWISTLPSELPLWELEFQWTPECSESNCKGQNPLDWGVSYIIGKILETRCLKWACTTHLDISNTNYGQKKGWESNCFDFLACKWCATTCWKAFNEGHNFVLDLTSIKRLHTNMNLQSRGSPNFGNFRTPTWESLDKMTFGCWPHGQAQRIL